MPFHRPLGPMRTPPSPRAFAHDVTESPREAGLIGKAGPEGDIHDRQAGREQKIPRALDPPVDEPAMGRHAEAGFERACKMADRKAASLRQLGETHRAVELLANHLGRQPLLPGRQAASGQRRLPRQPGISLQDMGTEDQAQLIEHQRTGPVARAHQGQDPARELGYDGIVFADGEFIGADRLDTMIARDLVQPGSRHMIMDIVSPRRSAWGMTATKEKKRDDGSGLHMRRLGMVKFPRPWQIADAGWISGHVERIFLR
jgi:hypothetical protein